MRKSKRNLSGLIRTLLWSGMAMFIPLTILAGNSAGNDTTGGVYGRDPLWQKAVELVLANRNLIPGNMEMRTEEMDSKGKLLNLHESWIRISPGDGGQVETEIIKVLKNGADITESQKQSQAQQSKGANDKKDSSSFNLWEEYPFDVNYQPALKSFSDSEQIQGKNCRVYEYFFRKPNKTTYRGTAWLEEKTGIPVKLIYTCDPLPQFVSRMETTVIFDSLHAGMFYPKEIQVVGAGSFLLMKRNFRMTMKCSNFWKR